MKSKIESLMIEEGSQNDFCRMIILFMSATIFFPNSNYSIGKSFMAHLQNFENMRKLGWTDLIYKELLNKVKDKRENPLYCACVIPLLVWFCEITGVMEPRSKYITGTPRIGKWKFSKLIEAWETHLEQNIAMGKISKTLT